MYVPRDPGHKPVPAARERLDEPRAWRAVAERAANLADAGVDAVLDVPADAAGPELPFDGFAGPRPRASRATSAA